jgi:organic hydroperoxide reductase OsmC/OhrA
MSEHKANIKWERNDADFGYKNYSRDHVWRFEKGVETPASAVPAYLGNPQRVGPESAFVAALSSCYMLTFLALASNKGLVVDSYEDNAVGRIEKNANGKLAVARVELRPRIHFGGDKQSTQAKLDWLHDKAHREWFHCELCDDRGQGRGRGLTRIRAASGPEEPAGNARQSLAQGR